MGPYLGPDLSWGCPVGDSRPTLERPWELALPKTLIVDDSAAFRGTVKEILLSEFPTMSVAEAADGKEAILQVCT